MGVVAELDCGGGLVVKKCCVGVVEPRFYLSSGDALLGAGMRKELLVMAGGLRGGKS